MQALPAHEATIGTGKKHEARRHLTRLARPSHRRRELRLSFLVHGRGNERRPDGPRAHGVDADAIGDLLVGKGTREGYDGAFGGSVVEEVGTPDAVGVSE